MFDTYIKENYKVVEYQAKTPSLRRHGLTWRPYRYYRKMRSITAHNRCRNIMSTYIIDANPAMEKRQKTRLAFDSDSYDILIDNCCSHTLTNDLKDYIEPPIKSKVRIRGYNSNTNSTKVGTVKWKIKDDNGKVHNFILPNTYYLPSVDVGIMRSAPGIKNYLTSCKAYDHEHATLAYPATINIGEDEAGLDQQAPDDQMREPINHEIEPLLHDNDTSVEDEYPSYSQDSQ
jgi:hypothetical protein